MELLETQITRIQLLAENAEVNFRKMEQRWAHIEGELKRADEQAKGSEMEETHNATTLDMTTLDTHSKMTDDPVTDGRDADGRADKIVTCVTWVKQEVKLPKKHEDQIVQL